MNRWMLPCVAVMLMTVASASSASLDAIGEVQTWSVKGDAVLSVEDGQLIVNGKGLLTKAFTIDLDQYSGFEARVAEAGSLYNLSVGVGNTQSVILRTERPARRDDSLAPHLGGKQHVTILLNHTGTGKLVVASMQFIAEAPSVSLPAPEQDETGQERIAIRFDAQELSRWTVKGNLRTQVEDGRLTIAGRGTMQRTFDADLNAFPTLRVAVTRASSMFNMGVTVASQPRQVVLRDDRPRTLHDAVPVIDRSSLTRKTKVTLDVIFTEGEYEVSELLWLAPTPPLGPPAPAEADELRLPEQRDAADQTAAVYIPHGSTTLAIWRATGCVAGAWDQTTSRRVVRYSADIYRVLSQKGEEQVAFEADDKVTSLQVAPDGRRVNMVCVNAALPGVRILKTYCAHQSEHVFTKRVEFQSDRDWNGLIYWESVVNLDPEFRRGGRYNNPDYHPRDFAFFEAAQIITDTKQPYRQQVIFYNPTLERTVGHHRMMIDDKPIGAQVTIPEHHDDRAYFTATGWRFFAMADRLWSGKNPSAEVHLSILPGDMIAYHRLYMALPEVTRSNTFAALPKWIDEVKGKGINANHGLKGLREWNDLLQEGYGVQMLIGHMDVSDYPTTGEWDVKWGGWQRNEKVSGSASRIHDLLRAVRQSAPRLKMAAYTWYHSVFPDSQVYKQHPDWFHRQRNGEYRVDQNGMVERLYTPEHLAWLKDRTTAIMRDFDLDYFYIDGGGFGETQVDWPTMRVIQPTDGAMVLARDLTVAPDKPVWVNAGNGLYQWYSPMSFYEGFIDVSDWRAMSIKLMELKLYQQPGTFCMPIHWSESDALRYSNYCTLLGLKGAVDIVRKYLPLVNMNYELHPMLMQDIGLRPRWFAAEDGDLETYALGFDRSQLLISMLNHKRQDADYEVTFDPSLTTLQPDRETYVYRLRPEPPSVFLYNRLSEPEDQQMYESHGWSPIALAARSPIQTMASPSEAAQHQLTIRGYLTEHLAITQTPGLIWSTNGHRKYFPLSRTRWGHVVGQRDGDVIRLTVHCEQPCELAAIIPREWTGVRATVAGETVEHRIAIPDLAIIPVPAGEHEVIVRRAADLPSVEIQGATIEAPASLLAGQPLAFAVHLPRPTAAATRMFVNISRDATPIYTGRAVDVPRGSQTISQHLELPQETLKGDYTIRVSLEGAPGFLDRPLKIDLPKIEYPNNWRQSSSETMTVQRIDKDVHGFRVLRRFSDVSAAGGTYTSDVDSGAFTVYVRAGSGYTAGFASAGLEFASVREVHANVSLATPPARETFDAEPEAHLTFTVDFHTPQGYAKRVYFNASKPIDDVAASPGPAWGVNSDEASANPLIQHVHWRQRYVTFIRPMIDLAEFAPPQWDGRVIMGVHMQACRPETGLFFRLRPQTRFSGGGFFIDPAHLGEQVGWKTGTYRTVTPIVAGEGDAASFDEKSMTLSARAVTPDGHAFARLLNEETFVITAKASGTGDTALIADYVAPEGAAKRAIFIVSGHDPQAIARRVRQIAPYSEFTGPVEVIDLREQFKSGAEFQVPFGTHAPDGWEADWGKKLLLGACALGKSSLSIQLVDMESFRRF